ncbi:MAG: hypothetical protein GKC10_05340 [Methanosarcinales archaeon]|nr:hypothetical protein [Methanosarcinales archaeon]
MGDRKADEEMNLYQRIFDQIEGGIANRDDPAVQEMMLYRRYFELLRQGRDGPEFREICKKIDQNKADRLREMIFNR